MQAKEVEKLFVSNENHTRKIVQMNSVARNFAMNFARKAPPEFGQTFTYTMVFLGKLDGEFVTLKNYLNGRFGKHINNTDDIFGNGSELRMKAETFVHYSYVLSAKQLMIVVDIKGVNYSLSDPEVESSTLMAMMEDTILFCSRNLSTTATVSF